MNLKDVIGSYNTYAKSLKGNLKKAVADYLAEVLPDGTSLEWSQGASLDDDTKRFDANSPIVHLTLKEPSDGGYYLDDGAAGYKNYVEGLTKADLRTLIAAWKALPSELLDKAFGNAVVRVSSKGKFTTEEN